MFAGLSRRSLAGHQAWIIAPPRIVDMVHLPSVSEPSLAWTISGEVEFQEREGKRPWITHLIKKGSFFLTSGGAPHDCRWKALTSEPFDAMSVFIELPLLHRALEEVFGGDAANVRLRDVSAFTDVALNAFMEQVRDELLRPHCSCKASPRPLPSILLETTPKPSTRRTAIVPHCPATNFDK